MQKAHVKESDIMHEEKDGLNRRTFLKAGLQATAGAAVLSAAGDAQAAVPKDKKVKFPKGMATRVLGKTGVRVPVLGFGGAMLPERWGGIGSLEDREKLIRYSYDKGVRWFDTSDNYMESEGIIGRALKDVRDNVYFATKVSVMQHAEVRGMVEQSLNRFETDYLDIIQIHGTTGIEQMSFDEAMRVKDELVKLRDEGVTRFIGVTGHNYFDKIYALIATGEFDTAFLANGYFHAGMTRLLTNEMVEMRKLCVAKAQELGMGGLAMKVMRGGMMGAGGASAAPDWAPEKLERLSGAAIRHVFQDERVHIFNIGMRTTSDIDENVKTLSGDMTFTNDDEVLLAEFSAKAYPWYEKRMEERRERWEKRRAEREKQNRDS